MRTMMLLCLLTSAPALADGITINDSGYSVLKLDSTWKRVASKTITAPNITNHIEAAINLKKKVGDTRTFEEKMAVVVTTSPSEDEDDQTVYKQVLVSQINVTVDCDNLIRVLNSVTSMVVKSGPNGDKLQINQDVQAAALSAIQALIGKVTRLQGLTDENAMVCAM